MKLCVFTACSVAAAASGIDFGPYPGYAGDLTVTGKGGAYLKGDSVGVWWNVLGVEAENCKTAPAGVSNACGIHIHEGTTCDDADAVGGHYYNTDSIASDPWSPITYAAAEDGSSHGHTRVTIGENEDISGRALVIHDSTGARIACGLLPTMPKHGGIRFGPYPGYTGDLKVTGHAGARLFGDNVEMYYELEGVESDKCATAPAGVANACGIHIHEGSTCDDADAVGGHYYNTDSITSDPWSPVTYSALKGGVAFGVANVNIGDDQNIKGRALVVHDSTGARVACSLLPAAFFMEADDTCTASSCDDGVTCCQLSDRFECCNGGENCIPNVGCRCYDAEFLAV